jgi:hypothetical protein
MALFDNADCLFGASVAVPFVKEFGVPFLELPLSGGGLGVSNRGNLFDFYPESAFLSM